APRAARRQARHAHAVSRADVPARLHLRRPPGARVWRGLQGVRPEAVNGHLRLDVLHAHRLPRPARDDRRHHAVGDLAPRAARPFHRAEALRVRGGGLVLALRRRSVARPVYIRLLAVVGLAKSRPRALLASASMRRYRLIRRPVQGLQRTAPGMGCSPWGVISPMYQAMMSSAKSRSDSEIRIVRARAILRESCSPLPRERWRKANPRLTTIAMSTARISSRTRDSILRPSSGARVAHDTPTAAALVTAIMGHSRSSAAEF